MKDSPLNSVVGFAICGMLGWNTFTTNTNQLELRDIKAKVDYAIEAFERDGAHFVKDMSYIEERLNKVESKVNGRS